MDSFLAIVVLIAGLVFSLVWLFMPFLLLSSLDAIRKAIENADAAQDKRFTADQNLAADAANKQLAMLRRIEARLAGQDPDA